MDALTLSFDGWHTSNVARVRSAISLSMRNEEIAAAYRQRPKGEKGTDAIARLAEAYGLSESRIERIVFPR